jgi:hypothetical protein
MTLEEALLHCAGASPRSLNIAQTRRVVFRISLRVATLTGSPFLSSMYRAVESFCVSPLAGSVGFDFSFS